jgi:hypothetical protein
MLPCLPPARAGSERQGANGWQTRPRSPSDVQRSNAPCQLHELMFSRCVGRLGLPMPRGGSSLQLMESQETTPSRSSQPRSIQTRATEDLPEAGGPTSRMSRFGTPSPLWKQDESWSTFTARSMIRSTGGIRSSARSVRLARTMWHQISWRRRASPGGSASHISWLVTGRTGRSDRRPQECV